MKNRSLPNRWFWITLLIPVAFLLSMAVQPVMAVMFGDTVALQTVPYDPKDLFYGDYVDLRFEIEEVGASLLDNELARKMKNSEEHERFPVYVSLKPKGHVYVVKQVSEKKPRTGLYLKGTIQRNRFDQNLNGSSDPVYFIDYPLDRFYVEEGTGLELEKLSREGKLVAYLKIKNGYAILTDVKPSP